MFLYVLKNKFTGLMAMIELCDDAVYLLDGENVGSHTIAFVYTEFDIQKVQDSLNGINDSLWTEIDPDHYDVVKIQIP